VPDLTLGEMRFQHVEIGIKDQLAQAQQNLIKWQGMLEKALKTTETKEKNPSQK
jgi:hypothetical protein